MLSLIMLLNSVVLLLPVTQAGITFHNVRRSPIIYRRPPPQQNINRKFAEKSGSEHEYEDDDNDQSFYYPPVRRKKPTMSERLLSGLSVFVPKLPSFPANFNIIRRSGGFRRFQPQPPFQSSSPPTTRRRRKETTRPHQYSQDDSFRPQYPRKEFYQRIGDDDEEESISHSGPLDGFDEAIEEFRTGLLVTDPRYNFYKTPSYHSNSKDRTSRFKTGMEHELQENMMHQDHQSRRHMPRRPEPIGGVSKKAGPPYPGPHPRNPRLPLDRTVIYP